jgi:hypothetical protein
MKIEKIAFRNWPNCYRLTNGCIELIVTSDFGPRVAYCALTGGKNLFAELPGDPIGKPDRWYSLGGHRFWVAPEAIDRTYYPDSQPVKFQQGDDFVRFTAPTEGPTGVQKEIEIRLAQDAAQARVLYRVYNRGLWPVELAPWALSVMAPGGVAILPLPPRGPHAPQNLLPTSSLVQWAYTDMSDPRWTWGREYVLLRQDPGLAGPQKVGAASYVGWAAYAVQRSHDTASANQGSLFVKTFAPQPGMVYPDMGCTVEFFTNESMLEVETLAPLSRLEPGEATSHTETWHLFDGLPAIGTEADVREHVQPLVMPLLALAPIA